MRRGLRKQGKNASKKEGRKEGCVWEGVKGGKDKSGGERRKEKGNFREKGNVIVKCGRCKNVYNFMNVYTHMYIREKERGRESSKVLVEEKGKRRLMIGKSVGVI